MFSILRKEKEQPVDEAQFEVIKHLVSELPKGTGWAATYDKEISKATMKKLTESGFLVIKRSHTGGKVYYKISQAPK